MSKTAHNKIRGDKALKKKIAEFLADFDLHHTPNLSMKTILMEGHRGFLAMGEKELYARFDKCFTALTKDELFEALHKNPISNTWSQKEAVKQNREHMLSQAKLVSDEIFEKTCLV